MGRTCFIFLLITLLAATYQGYSQSVAISSYYNAGVPEDEWTELLVTADNTDMRNWTLGDNNAAQTSWQPVITFNNIALWNNLRAGTIIMIWHRVNSSAAVPHPVDNDKSDGYIEVAAFDPNYFTGGNTSATLNIAAGGDLLRLTGPAPPGTFIHALGHIATIPPAGSWAGLPAAPKLNYKGSLAGLEALFVSPGGALVEYGTTPPQDGTTWTAKSNANLSFGLPNNATTNSDFWRSLRQPSWTSPVLSGSVNTTNTTVTLSWYTATDPNPVDGYQGYMILRNTTNTFTNPVDGVTYAIGDILGGASVVALITSSQQNTWLDNTPVPCNGGFYYRIYAYRYIADNVHGNGYDLARGRGYNETNFGEVNVTFPTAVAPVAATSDRDNFCADDNGNITLSVAGGSGTTLNWYQDNCGGTLLGAGAGANNSITIPSPAVTTTYYARWENACGNSPCASVTVTVLPNVPVSASIIASPGSTVCPGTTVIYTATVENGGTSPIYQWFLNGNPVGSNSSTYSNIPVNGDNIYCIITSSETCASGNPATSNTITITISAALPVSVSISASPGNVICAGTTVIYTALPENEGTAPVYNWFLNGNPVGTNSPSYSNTPINGDAVYCILTSSESCATGNPATSNTITITISTALPVGVSISAYPGNVVCAGTTVIYTALPENEGTAPVYQWFLNGNPVGTNSSTYSNTPVDGDAIYCILTSSESCATGNPATSNTVTITLSASFPVSVSIIADPGVVICAGTTVIYTATPENGGTTPSFQWFLNGNPVGSNSPTFSNNPVDGDAIYCVVTSNLPCASTNPATSNTVTISISTLLPVSVSVSANSANLICAGTPVVFTASPVNEGTSPAFQWYVNGNPVGTNSSTYSYIPANADAIYCMLTSSLSCATGNPATSGTITITTTIPLPVSVSITADPGDTICNGTAVTFTASPVNGGTSPIFQWYLNGAPVGGNNLVYTCTPADGDVISCMLTSDLTCITNNPATSNLLTMVYTAVMSANVTIAADHNALCPGTTVTFTATPLNGGTSASYEWLVNGVTAQQGSSKVFTTSSLSGGQPVTCRMTSSLSCLVSNPVESTPVTLPAAAPPVVKLSDKEYLCAGKPEVLDAGEGFIAYQWQDGDTARYYTASNEGIYWVQVTDTLGCNGSDSIKMEVCKGSVYVPTAFSPNGDGWNDIFKVISYQENITAFSLMIFDRWGQEIFETQDIKSGWDGKVKGMAAQVGTYAWKVTYRVGSEEKNTVLAGTVTVIL